MNQHDSHSRCTIAYQLQKRWPEFCAPPTRPRHHRSPDRHRSNGGGEDSEDRRPPPDSPLPSSLTRWIGPGARCSSPPAANLASRAPRGSSRGLGGGLYCWRSPGSNSLYWRGGGRWGGRGEAGNLNERAGTHTGASQCLTPTPALTFVYLPYFPTSHPAILLRSGRSGRSPLSVDRRSCVEGAVSGIPVARVWLILKAMQYVR